jgi:heme oxygenase
MLAKERPFLTPRQRADRAARDLAALGRSPREIARLPLCLAAARLVRSPEAAIGSLYVLEGSTLGGQIISRGLAGAPWLPAEGLGYFDPYGVATGTMWRQFRIWAETVSTTSGTPAIIAGAVATFDTLHAWLTATAPNP